jgi:hypothetical protein
VKEKKSQSGGTAKGIGRSNGIVAMKPYVRAI